MPEEQFKCPSCGESVLNISCKYCPNCGQSLVKCAIEQITDENLRQLLVEADVNGDGVVTHAEYQALIARARRGGAKGEPGGGGDSALLRGGDGSVVKAHIDARSQNGATSLRSADDTSRRGPLLNVGA